MPEPVEMTREQLYDLVWSMPMRDAAESIPMTYLSLKKVCLKHQVPVPPAGHWSKSLTNRAADKLPLPLSTLGNQRIWIRRFLQRKPATLPLTGQAEMPPGQIHTHRHGCTRRTKRALEDATPDRRGALVATGAGVASVRVAPETVPRALALLEHLIGAIEKRGHSISMQTSPAKLFVEGQHVPMTIFEKFEECLEAADAAEMKRRATYERRYPDYFRRMDFEAGWTHRPSGKLTIILSDGNLHGLPSRWADSASHPVESRADEVVAGAVAHATALRARRERIEQRLAERRETQAQREQAEKESEKQARRTATLEKYASNLEKVERLDRFLQHLRQTSDGYHSPKMFAFMSWAEAHIAELRESCSAPAVDRDISDSELW